MTAEEHFDSLFTVSVAAVPDPQKVQSIKVKPGNNGIISSNILDSNKIEVMFSPVSCDGRNCPSIPKYYLIMTKSI